MCDDDSPSALVPRSAFYDIETPAVQQQCSPRKGARIANGEGGAGGPSETPARDADATAAAAGGTTAAAIATKPPPPKRVSFASHVQVSSGSSSSSSASKSRREKPRKTKGGDEEGGGSVEEEGSASGRTRSLVFSALVLVAVCSALFAAGWSARGKSSPKGTIVEGDLWQAAPSRGETVLGTGPSRGFVLPGAKQGIHDQRWWDSHGLSAAMADSLTSASGSGSTTAAAAAAAAASGAAPSSALLYPNPPLDRLPAAARDRYAAYDLVSPGVKRYNVWWASHEAVYPPPPPSSSSSAAPAAPARGGGGGSRNVAVSSAAVSSSPLSQAEGGAILADAARGGEERGGRAASAPASARAAASPPSCPAGSFTWPLSEAHRRAVNASRFHCYDARQDAILQGYLALDAAHGVQSYATIWKAPAAARHPGCAGFDNGNGSGGGGGGGGGGERGRNASSSSSPPTLEFGGCAPNWDPQAMADFADFITYLADRHRLSGGGFLAKQQQRRATASPSSSGNGAGGGFAGYIIWNEAASALWFDTSPFIAPISGILTNQTQAERWADAYAALLEAAERSLRSVGARPALVLASLDTLWASPGEKGPLFSSSAAFPLGGVHAGRAHLGSGNLVEALWKRLGTRVDWSLAVHPYSTPIAPGQVPSRAASPSPSSTTLRLPAILHFSDLRRLSELQAERAAEAPSKIGGVRVGADKGRRSPQAAVAATEQGWPALGGRAPAAAAAICEAHSTVAPRGGAAKDRAASEAAAAAAAAAAVDQGGAVGVAFVTHNDFQGVSAGDATGLVPAAAGAALRSLEPGASPTLSAYESTRVGVWNVESGHYCCAVAGVGCGGGGGSGGGGSAR